MESETVEQVSACSQMFAAVDEDDCDTLLKLIQGGASVNSVNAYMCTPLHWAGLRGSLGSAELLVAHGAAVNTLTGCRRTPLHEAASRGRLALVRLLIRSGGDVGSMDYSARLPLHLACTNNHVDVVRSLIDSQSPLDAESVPQRKTPLLEALCYGNVEVARLLVIAGCDVTKADKEGKEAISYVLHGSPLSAASLELLGLLLEAGGRFSKPHSELARKLHGSSSVNMIEWIEKGTQEPRSLKSHLCVALRKHMYRCSNHKTILAKLHNLPLPRTLLCYVTLKSHVQEH